MAQFIATNVAKLMQQPHFKYELVSWNKVMQLNRVLAGKILDSGYRPEVVVAIARGGYTPARLLCDYLNLYSLTSLQITHYTHSTRSLDDARLCAGVTTNVRAKNVLLVDDVTDSGDTLQLARRHLGELQPAQIKTAALHHKTSAPAAPDYYGVKITAWRWLIYPWAVIEDINEILNSMADPPGNAQSAAQVLAQRFHLQLSLSHLTDVYRFRSLHAP